MTARQLTVLHYTGSSDDRGGIHSLIRSLAGTGKFSCVIGLSRGGNQRRVPALPQIEFPRVEAEKISLLNLWRARLVAVAVRAWLQEKPERVFHGHSRAGLLVALWLHWEGETRVVVSVHCYGRRRWFYRWAARQLGSKLFWLSPAMRAYYGLAAEGWQNCIPGGVTLSAHSPARREPRRLRLGGIGELVAWKQWEVVIEAIALLSADQRARISFEHIGPDRGGRLPGLLALRDRLGLAHCIEFRGEQPSSAGLLDRIDALVIASRDEPFSIAMLEALAAGVPVIAADSGGARDVIRPDINGALYATGDVAALSRVLSEWLEANRVWEPEKIRESTITIDRIAAEWNVVYARV